MTVRIIRNTPFLLALLLLPLASFSQSLSSSPYSTFGLGDPEPNSFAPNTGMGGVQTAFVSNSQINPGNPASYAGLNQPAFSVGGKGTRLGITSNGTTSSTSFAYLKNISIGIPVSKRWKSAAGIMPYSRLGYDLSSTETVDGFGSVDYSYSGSGSLNSVYWGNSFTLIRDTSNVLAVGMNAHYLFGQFAKSRTVQPADNLVAFDIQNTNTAFLQGFDVDFGAFYLHKFGKNRVIVGATYGLGNSIEATSSEFTYSLSGGDNQFVEDSIQVVTDLVSDVKLPSSLGFGITYEYGSKLTISADYRIKNWSELNYDENPLLNATTMAIGIQYISGKEDNNVLSLLRYRTGFRYGNTRLQSTTGEQVDEYGITFGLGLPLVKSGSRTNFNVALEVGQRGKDAPGLIREQFTSFSVGVTYLPNKFDTWFVKRRID